MEFSFKKNGKLNFLAFPFSTKIGSLVADKFPFAILGKPAKNLGTVPA